MDSKLRDRLRRLGVKQGRDGLRSKKNSEAGDFSGRPGRPASLQGDKTAKPYRIESLVPGRDVITHSGNYFVAETAYSLAHRHGSRALADVIDCDPRLAARLSRHDSLAGSDLSRLAFLDIETTGLAGGTGTLAFLIGIGLIENEQFTLRQFFLRSPAEEAALLHGVADALQDKVGLVTYNGRAFDVPIVQTRFTMARRPFDLTAYPNLDLLPAARRLWRGLYENCSLGTLETAVLGLHRTEADVPGALIPQLYVDYLRTGDAREMKRVIYHNAEDILSMVSLAAHILETFADPVGERRTGLDCLRLAMWHDDHDDEAEAETAYRTALQRARSIPIAHRPTLYDRYSAFLKRTGRRADAVLLWEKWADLADTDPTPCIELAKYYEWEISGKDIKQAKEWASRALVCVTHWPKGWQKDEAWKQIKHRLERLGRKE